MRQGMSIRQIFLILVIPLLFIIGCHKEKPPVYVAKVGNSYITLSEFKQSYEFNPYLDRVNPPDSAKKLLLYSMIAEKMLAQEEAQHLGKARERLNDLVDEYRREAMIEAFWKQIIIPKVKVSEEELRQAYKKSKVKKIIRYLLFTDAGDAKKAYAMIQNGMSFEQVARMRGFAPEQIPIDTITFKGTLPNIEDQVFKMKIGQVSPPIKEGFYYFIVKLVDEKINLFTSESDYQQVRHSLYKQLKRRKEEEAFLHYLKEHVPSPPYVMNEERFKALVQMLEQYAFKELNPKKENILPDDLYYAFKDKNNDILKKTIVTFYDGTAWSVKDLLKRMMLAPYPVRFDNPKIFRESMLLSARHVLDDEIIVKQAQKLGLEKSEYVREQTKMWQDFFYFKKALAKVFRGKDLSDINALGAYLNSIKHKYPVVINHAVLDTLHLQKTGMAVLKEHFPGRVAIPLFTLIPRWKP